jgi:hypothetical protein
MNNNNPLRKCDKCKITKPKNLFYRYRYCKRCHIKNYINEHLCNARIANHLNLSIDELKNIMRTDIIEEHQRYDEVIMYYTGHNMINSTIITNDIIDNFLDEPIVPF